MIRLSIGAAAPAAGESAPGFGSSMTLFVLGPCMLQKSGASAPCWLRSGSVRLLGDHFYVAVRMIFHSRMCRLWFIALKVEELHIPARVGRCECAVFAITVHRDGVVAV